MLLSTARQFGDELEFLASSLNYAVSLEDLMVLSEINTDILVDIETIQSFFVREPLEIKVVEAPEVNLDETPWLAFRDCTWRKIFDIGWMISEYGDVYDIEKKCIKRQAFIDGDMRVIMNEGDLTSAKRVAPLVTRAFGITSGDRSGNYIIEHIDGDRRNLSCTNLRWIPCPKDRPTDMQYLVEDICRRLVEFNGNTEEVLKMYENSRPVVTRNMIQEIRNKTKHSAISDKFFVYQNGSFFPREHMKKVENVGLKIGEYFLVTGDLNMSLKLIKDKVNNGMQLMKDENEILIKDYQRTHKKCFVEDVREYLVDSFGVKLPLDYIQEIMNDDESTIAQSMKGVV